MFTRISTASTFFLLVSPLATAQWSSDPAQNLAVADTAGDQVLPKVAATADGGCYIGWFDSIANGFDVRLQLLDAAGQEQWTHGGILVCDRGFSSVQDWGIDVDASGDALLAFRDDNGSTTQIIASRVSPGGTLIWGATGIALIDTTAFVASPAIAGTSDGGAVVTWTQDSSAVLQKLDGMGGTLWGAGVTLTPAVGAYIASDLHDSGTDVILSIVYQSGPMFWDPKHLVAQKFDVAGNALWGAGITVFDGGSLQIGNYPPFTPDGSGGAVFAWYAVSPLQSFAQHILANGTEAFPHNGVSGSTDGSQVRVSPSVDHDAVTGSTIMFWEEQNSGQSQFGLYGQKYDAAGNRQWGPTGTMLIPIGNPEIRNVRTAVSGAGAFVYWTHIPSLGTDTMHGAHVDAAGSFDIGPFDVSSTPSGISRPDLAHTSSGQMILAWSDSRTDNGDIYAQNVNPDGSLGVGEDGTGYCFGDPGSGTPCPCANDNDGSVPGSGCDNGVSSSGAKLAGSGYASVSNDSLVLSTTGLEPNNTGLYFQANNVINGGDGNPFGDGLRCAGGGLIRLQIRFADGSGTSMTTIGIATKGGVVAGDVKRYQCWYRTTQNPPCGLGVNDFNLSNGYEILWAP